MFVSDNNYVNNLGVCSYSVLHNMCGEAEHVRLFVMDCGITEENRARLLRQTSRFENAEMFFFDITGLLDQIAPKVPTKWNRAIYGRLFLTDLISRYSDIERIVYLDCDLLMDRPVTALFSMPMQGKCIGGVVDVMSEERKKELGIKPSNTYVNSGVLLIDTARWKELNASERIISFINSATDLLHYPDQDAINYVLQDDILVIPPAYNMMWMLRKHELSHMAAYMAAFAFPEEELYYAHYHGRIYHFAGNNMWGIYGISPIFSRLFQKYHRLSDWRKEKRKFGSVRNFYLCCKDRTKLVLRGDWDNLFRYIEKKKLHE